MKKDVSQVDKLLHHDPSFPEPVVKLGQSNIYLWTEIRVWFEHYETHKPSGGRKLGESVSKNLPPELICTWGGCTNKKHRDKPFCHRHWNAWQTQHE